MSNTTIYIAQGDTIKTRTHFTKIVDNVQMDMGAPGWLCHMTVLSYPDRAPLTTQRQITDIAVIDGQNYFLGSLSHAESLSLAVPDSNRPEHYIWSIRVSNPSLGFYDENDIDLIVRKSAITA